MHNTVIYFVVSVFLEYRLLVAEAVALDISINVTHSGFVGKTVFQNPYTSSSLRPKIHGYTACKRTEFVKPDSVKFAMGHLLHGEAAP